LWVQQWRNFTPEVRPNGFIIIPIVDVKVAGLTAGQAEERIKEELSKYIKVPRVEVRIKEYKSKKVSLLGSINMVPVRASGPGEYVLKGKTTITEMITQAGGPTPNASMDKVQLRRADGTTLAVNLLKIILEGDFKENVILDAGDEIYIPAIEVGENKVLVFGEVKSQVYTRENLVPHSWMLSEWRTDIPYMQYFKILP